MQMDNQNTEESEDSSYDPMNETDSENQSIPDEQIEREYIGPVLPGGHRFDKKLLCIKYPANVVNVDKALDTLGGINEISETANAKNRRLELRFRPDDAYCKPTCGNRHSASSFLLRIRVKKSRIQKSQINDQEKVINCNNSNNLDNNTSLGNSENGVHENNHKSNEKECKPPTFDPNKYENLSNDNEYQLPKIKVLGQVDTEFKFTSLCDFQYLPVVQNKDTGKSECIYEQIYPTNVPPYSWTKSEVPLFLPPAAFSRMDSIQIHAPKVDINAIKEDYLIGKTRKRRSGLSNYINFSNPNVPTKAPQGIETALKVKFLQNTHLEKMKQLFEERPIWSKIALAYVTKFTFEQLKILLPAVAYYFTTGPWRITWVRLGYDPRKNSESRIYQILDYRLKAMHGLHGSITCKRNYSNYMLPYKSVSSCKAKEVVLTSNTNKFQSKKKIDIMEENVYIYRDGILPPSRQMFYQYCDLEVPEIQEMFSKYEGPPPGSKCHEKYGWLFKGFDEICREIINKQVRVVLRRVMNIPENLPTKLPPKRVPKFGKSKRKKYIPTKRPPVKKPVPLLTSLSSDEDLSSIQLSDSEWQDVPFEEMSIDEPSTSGTNKD